ncbi:DUF1707 domain-containing protein [Streptomyces tricolor]|nr:DUF1707 domain-containing protein [Streptomyces tricolor]
MLAAALTEGRLDPSEHEIRSSVPCGRGPRTNSPF